MGKIKYHTTEDFIKKAQEIHGDTYDYSETEYVKYKAKIKVICREHGEFWIDVGHHLHGQGCQVCRYIKSAAGRRRPLEKVIELANKVHNSKYDYSLITEYKNDRVKYPIICPKHGVFHQTMNNHIFWKEKCPQCAIEQQAEDRKYTTEDFILKAIETHGEKYDYSKVEYVDSKTNVCIICPKHGEFWQIPRNHLHGQGCPICKESKLEMEICQFLEENNIDFIRQFKCDWLKRQTLDFYLPQYNAAIECQGKQHFIDDGFGEFELTIKRDETKRELCETHNVKLLYYSNLNINYPYKVYENKEELLKEIKE